MILFRGSVPVWLDWDFLKGLGDKFSYISSRNNWQQFGMLQKTSLWVKTRYFLGKFCKIEYFYFLPSGHAALYLLRICTKLITRSEILSFFNLFNFLQLFWAFWLYQESENSESRSKIYNVYRRFIKSFGIYEVAKPEVFKWTEEARETFEELKVGLFWNCPGRTYR